MPGNTAKAAAWELQKSPFTPLMTFQPSLKQPNMHPMLPNIYSSFLINSPAVEINFGRSLAFSAHPMRPLLTLRIAATYYCL